MAVQPGTNQLILEAVRDRLRAKVSGFNEQNCFISDRPIPDHLTEGILLCTVSPTESRFPDHFQAGGGYRQVVEEFGFNVSLLSWVELDEPGREQHALLHSTEGMLSVHKRPILRALLYDDDNGTHWHITDSGGDDILRNDISVVSCTQPQRMRKGQGQPNWVGMTMRFRTVFDWDLTT